MGDEPEDIPTARPHPYRASDAAREIDPELDRCLRWCRARIRRVRMTSSIVPLAALAACVALARVHWVGWLGFGIIALWVGTVTFVWLYAARAQSRFEQRLRADPGRLAWAHIETEPARGMLCACELQLQDGESSTFYVATDMANRLAERASRWPFPVTRTPAARARYQLDCQLRRIEAQVRRPEDSLASSLAPFLLPAIEGRSSAGLPEAAVASLKPALDELEHLFRVAAEVDTQRSRAQNKNPTVAELLASTVYRDPPFSEKATGLVHVIREALASAAERAP